MIRGVTLICRTSLRKSVVKFACASCAAASSDVDIIIAWPQVTIAAEVSGVKKGLVLAAIHAGKSRASKSAPAASVAGSMPSTLSGRFIRQGVIVPKARRDRKSVVSGKRVSVSVDLGGRRIIKKKHRRDESNKDYITRQHR